MARLARFPALLALALLAACSREAAPPATTAAAVPATDEPSLVAALELYR